MTERVTYHVEGLDCAEEIALLRKEVGGRKGVKNLDFDLLNARMTVAYEPRDITPAEIVAAAAGGGMRATPWEARSQPDRETSRRRNGRLITTCAAGLFLLAGFIAHASVLVQPGERIPLDGRVSAGASAVNQAPITGESMPVAKSAGDELFAGTINGDGALEFEVTRVAEDTTLARITRMVAEAHGRRAPSEQWAEKFARYYTPAMMLLALAVFILPPVMFHESWAAWFYGALVILVIACPCALVISTPSVSCPR